MLFSFSLPFSSFVAASYALSILYIRFFLVVTLSVSFVYMYPLEFNPMVCLSFALLVNDILNHYHQLHFCCVKAVSMVLFSSFPHILEMAKGSELGSRCAQIQIGYTRLGYQSSLFTELTPFNLATLKKKKKKKPRYYTAEVRFTGIVFKMKSKKKKEGRHGIQKCLNYPRGQACSLLKF